MPAYTLQPGGHRILFLGGEKTVPPSSSEFEAVFEDMEEYLIRLLRIHPNTQNEDYAAILRAYKAYLKEMAGRGKNKTIRWKKFGTATAEGWCFNMRLLHNLKFFVEDKERLLARIAEEAEEFEIAKKARTADLVKKEDTPKSAAIKTFDLTPDIPDDDGITVFSV